MRPPCPPASSIGYAPGTKLSGERIPGMRGEYDIVIIIDTKFAASMGVQFYRAENDVLMARTPPRVNRPRGIPSTAIREVREYPTGKRIYPTGPGEYIDLPKWGTKGDGPVFPQEVGALDKLPPPAQVDPEAAKKYPCEDVVYQDTRIRTPMYMRCIRTSTGECYLVRREVRGLKQPLKLLIDTGAQIIILPLDTYLRIPEAHRPKVEPVDH